MGVGGAFPQGVVELDALFGQRLLEVVVVIRAPQPPGELPVVGGGHAKAVPAVELLQDRLAGGQALPGVGAPEDLVDQQQAAPLAGGVGQADQGAHLRHKVALPGGDVIPHRHGGEHRSRPEPAALCGAGEEALSQNGVDCQCLEERGLPRGVGTGEEHVLGEPAAVFHRVPEQGVKQAGEHKGVFLGEFRAAPLGQSGPERKGGNGQIHQARGLEQCPQLTGISRHQLLGPAVQPQVPEGEQPEILPAQLPVRPAGDPRPHHPAQQGAEGGEGGAQLLPQNREGEGVFQLPAGGEQGEKGPQSVQVPLNPALAQVVQDHVPAQGGQEQPGPHPGEEGKQQQKGQGQPGQHRVEGRQGKLALHRGEQEPGQAVPSFALAQPGQDQPQRLPLLGAAFQVGQKLLPVVRGREPVELGIQHLLPHRALAAVEPPEHQVHVQVRPGGVVNGRGGVQLAVGGDVLQGVVLLGAAAELSGHPAAQLFLIGDASRRHAGQGSQRQQEQEEHRDHGVPP